MEGSRPTRTGRDRPAAGQWRRLLIDSINDENEIDPAYNPTMTPDKIQCAFRRGFGASYWRCPKGATAFFWHLTDIDGVCDSHRDAAFDGLLEVMGTYVPFAYASEHGRPVKSVSQT